MYISCISIFFMTLAIFGIRALRTQKSHYFTRTSTCILKMSSAPAPPTAYLLKYDYVEGILDKRGPYREEHLGLAKDLVKEGKMLCAGPYSDASGALFIFTKSQTDAIEFVEKDPYVKAGLVPSYEIKQWSVGVNGEILDQSKL